MAKNYQKYRGVRVKYPLPPMVKSKSRKVIFAFFSKLQHYGDFSSDAVNTPHHVIQRSHFCKGVFSTNSTVQRYRYKDTEPQTQRDTGIDKNHRHRDTHTVAQHRHRQTYRHKHTDTDSETQTKGQKDTETQELNYRNIDTDTQTRKHI